METLTISYLPELRVSLTRRGAGAGQSSRRSKPLKQLGNETTFRTHQQFPSTFVSRIAMASAQ